MRMFVVFLTSLCWNEASYAMETLHYEPSIVTLKGTLSLQDFAGPPNYEDVKKGDRLERYWILTLGSPVRVIATPDDELFSTQENVREIQLVCSEDCGKQFSLSSGKEAILTGTLFSAHSGHHHKSVMMTVKKRK